MEKLSRTQYSPEFRQQSVQSFKESGLKFVEAESWLYAVNLSC